MQFQRKTSQGVFSLLIKVLIVVIIFQELILVAKKIDFPKPSKKIEKVIPNETFKIIK